ncbi:MAG: acyloxyacyl hydrolase [Flavobacterium sp.]
MFIAQIIRNRKIYLLAVLLYSFSMQCNSQTSELYPPFTKWYQDPLGLRPLQLSTAVGFAWGAAAVAACIIFTKNDSLFQKKFSLYQDAGMGFGYKSPYTCSIQNDVGVKYDVRKWLSLGLGWNSFHFKDEVNNTWAFGLRPFARWYPYKGQKINLYFEYGAGVSYSLNRFPMTGTGWEADTARTGTHFNLTSKYSAGAEFIIGKRISLQAGARHFHLSNGNMKGIKRNPSYDSNGFFVGVIYGIDRRR